METISELRLICQNSRTGTKDNELGLWKDFLNKFYYFISIYFTWILIRLRFTANGVTILSGVIAIIGGYLISIDNRMLIIMGFILFHIFAILDMCDGEVARYNKSSSINGQFLDWFMHFIYSFGFMGGLSLYVILKVDSAALIIIALISLAVSLFDKIITSATWTAIIWTKLRRFNNPNKLNFDEKKKYTSHSINKINKLVRFLFYHLFSDHWAKLSLLILSMIDLFLYLFSFNFIDYRFLAVLYLGLCGPIYIFIRVKNIIAYNNLSKAYNRVFIYNEKPKFPDDDFV